jgi:mRNA interferase MazF
MQRGRTYSRHGSFGAVSILGFIAGETPACSGTGRGDWILCQITSNPYGDTRAIMIDNDSFATGSLRVVSYVRPGKLFTAHSSLIVTLVGSLKAEVFNQVIETVINLLRGNRKQ